MARGGGRVAAAATTVRLQVSTRKSGGRDAWSPPLEEVPTDRVAAVWECLREVLDPEMPVSLVELGLVYGVEVLERTAHLKLTFTATACPCMEFIREDVTDRLLAESWLEEVRIVEVWDPPWTTERVTPEGRKKLARMGVGV